MEFLTHTLLPDDEIKDIQQRLLAPDLPWRDGRLTAGDQAALVKQNHQLAPDSELTFRSRSEFHTALTNDPLIKSFFTCSQGS